jgi:hypothetical protein
VALCAVISIGAVVLAACGGGGSSSTTATTAGSKKQAAAVNDSSDPSKQIDALSSSVDAASKATFKAVYTTSGTGSSGEITIEQKPPKSIFNSGDTSVINDGTSTIFCSNTGGQKSCTAQSGAANPMASLVTLFSPAAAIAAMKQAHSALAAKVAGYNVSFTSETFGGQSSSCMTVNAHGQEGKYCVTKSGILAYSGTAASYFQLSSYSSDVPDSDFAVPAGATSG